MIENLPGYISTVFILTTFLTLGIFLYAVKQTVFDTLPAKIFIFLSFFWLIFTAVMALNGFYLKTDEVPPRVLLFGVIPAFLLIIAYFIFARKSFIEPLSLKILTLLHVIRVPVEMVLWWLYREKLIPELMTFEGRNFDILAGITAPIMAWLAFRGGKVNKTLLIIWNLICLGLLINIVTHAILSFPFPYQQLAFDQPNLGVLFFPFIWLPAIVVPVVLFSHLISLWKLFKNKF